MPNRDSKVVDQSSASAVATAAAAPKPPVADTKDSKHSNDQTPAATVTTAPVLPETYTAEAYLADPSRFKDCIQAWVAANRFDLIERLVKSFPNDGNAVYEKAINENDFYTQLAIIIYSPNATRVKAYKDASIAVAYEQQVSPALYARCFNAKSAAAELLRCAELTNGKPKSQNLHHWQVVEALLDAHSQMEVDKTSKDGTAALLYAAIQNEYRIARKIADRSNKVNHKNKYENDVASFLKGDGEDQLAIALKYINQGGAIYFGFAYYVVKLLSRYPDNDLLKNKLVTLCQTADFDPSERYDNPASVYEMALANNDGQSLAIMIRHTEHQYLSGALKGEGYSDTSSLAGIDFVTQILTCSKREFRHVLELLIKQQDITAIVKYLSAPRSDQQQMSWQQQAALLVLFVKANRLDLVTGKILGSLYLNAYQGALNQLISDDCITEAANLINIAHKNFNFGKNEELLDQGFAAKEQKQKIVINAVQRYLDELRHAKQPPQYWDDNTKTRVKETPQNLADNLQKTLDLIPDLSIAITAPVFEHFAATSNYEAMLCLSAIFIANKRKELIFNSKQYQQTSEKLVKDFQTQCSNAVKNATQASATVALGDLDQKYPTTTASSGGAPAIVASTPQSQSAARLSELSKTAKLGINKTFALLLDCHKQFKKVYPNEYNSFAFQNRGFHYFAQCLLEAETEVEKHIQEGFYFLKVAAKKFLPAGGVQDCYPIAKTVIELAGPDGFADLAVRDLLLTTATGLTRKILIQNYSANCTDNAVLNQFVVTYSGRKDWHCILSLDENICVNVDTFNTVLTAIVDDDVKQDNLEDKVKAMQKLFTVYHPASADKHKFAEFLDEMINNGKFVLARAMLMYGGQLLPAKEQLPALTKKLVEKYRSTEVSPAQKVINANDYAQAKSTIDYNFVSELDKGNATRKNAAKDAKHSIDRNKTECQRELAKCLLTDLIAVETDHRVLCKEFLALNGGGLPVPLLCERQPIVFGFDFGKLTGKTQSASWDAVRKEARIKAAALVNQQLATLPAAILVTNYADEKAVETLLTSISQARLTTNVLRYDGEITAALATVYATFSKLPADQAQQLMTQIATAVAKGNLEHSFGEKPFDLNGGTSPELTLAAVRSRVEYHGAANPLLYVYSEVVRRLNTAPTAVAVSAVTVSVAGATPANTPTAAAKPMMVVPAVVAAASSDVKLDVPATGALAKVAVSVATVSAATVTASSTVPQVP